MNPITLVLVAAGVVVVGEWAAGNSAGTLASDGISLPGGSKAPAGTVIVGGFISALMISVLADAGEGPRHLAMGLAWLLLVGAILGPGTAIFKGLGLYPGTAQNRPAGGPRAQ